MDTLFERLNSPITMIDAEDELLANGEDAVPRLRALLDGSSKNEWGISYRALGLPLRCALEMAVRLGPLSKPLEPYIIAELGEHEAAARALGAMGELTPNSVECLAVALTRDDPIAWEAAAALVRTGEDRSPTVEHVIASSDEAANLLDKVRRHLRFRG